MTKITERAIKGAISKLQSGQANRLEFHDDGERGAGRLYIVVRRGKTRVTTEWYAQWYRDGERLSTKLGDYPALTLAAARKLFREEYVPEILAGKDPTGPRTWTKRRDATITDLFEAYVQHLEDSGRAAASIKKAQYALLSPTAGAAKALGATRPASAITTADIISHLRTIHGRGAIHQAHNVRAWIQAAFKFGLKSANSYHEKSSGTDWGLRENPVAVIPNDPAAFIPGDRVLTVDEYRAFWNWLTHKGASVRYRFAPAMQLMMATGQRPTEILRLGPTSFDRERGEVNWPKTKNGRPHCIPLPRQAQAILEAATANEHGWYFPRQRDAAKHADHSVCEWIIGRYLEESGAEPFSARDLRRTWKTLAGAAGLSKEIRDRLQNHALNDVSSKHYDRYDYLEEKRQAMSRWEGRLAEILTGDPAGEVQFARPVRKTKPKVKVGAVGSPKLAA